MKGENGWRKVRHSNVKKNHLINQNVAVLLESSCF